MTDFNYKQQLQIPCGTCSPHRRAHLIDSTIHGYICCIVEGAVLCYSFHRYLNALGSCNLRRDKALPSHPADLVIECREPAIWVAFNSTGLTMAILTSHPDRGGTFVHLVQLVDAIKNGPRMDLAQCTFMSIRVCGGEHGVTASGLPGLEPCDFAWNPTVENSFVVCLQSGSLRLFEIDQSQATANMIGHLPATSGATCVSWSPKGKQLAICLVGHLTTSGGTAQGPLFLQTDAQLRVKRIVSLVLLLKEVDGGAYPLDLLWTSPSCFILGVHSPVTGSMRTLFVSAPSKSQDPPTCSEIVDLRGRPDGNSTQTQYYFRLLSNTSHVVASLSGSGEMILLLKLPPSGSPDVLSCQPVVHVELPPSGSVLGLTVGFSRVTDDSSATILLSYISVMLTSGNLCTYLFHSPSMLGAIEPSLPRPVELPALKAPVMPDTAVNSSAVQEQLPNQENQQIQQQQNLQQQQQDEEKQMKERQIQQQLLEQQQRQLKPLQEEKHTHEEQQQRLQQLQQQHLLEQQQLQRLQGETHTYEEEQQRCQQLQQQQMQQLQEDKQTREEQQQRLQHLQQQQIQQLQGEKHTHEEEEQQRFQQLQQQQMQQLQEDKHTREEQQQRLQQLQQQQIQQLQEHKHTPEEQQHQLQREKHTHEGQQQRLQQSQQSLEQHLQGATHAGQQKVNPQLQCVASKQAQPVHQAPPAVQLVVTAHTPLQLPKSVRLATEHFTTALQSEAEAGRSAWHDLMHTMQHGLSSSAGVLDADIWEGSRAGKQQQQQSTGVGHIEARLQDAARFLQSLGEVNSELTTAVQNRKADLSNAMNYAEHVRRAVRLCSTGDWTPAMLNNKLDPKASRLLHQLQRHGRLLESGLLELESQIESKSSSASPATAKQANLIRTLNMTDRLIITERNRVDYLMQSLGRLRLDDTGDQQQKRTPVRKGAPATSDPPPPSSPWLTHLVHRDRSLYRLLFAAGHSLRVVHAQSSYPPALPAGGLQSDAEALVSSPQPDSPIVLSKGQVVSHPQHTKLEQLIQQSAQAAVASSPPRSPAVEQSAPAPSCRPPPFTTGDTAQSPATPIPSGRSAVSAGLTSTQSGSGFTLGQKAATPPTVKPISSIAGVFSTTSPGVTPMRASATCVAPATSLWTTAISSPVTSSVPTASAQPPPANVTVTTNSFLPPRQTTVGVTGTPLLAIRSVQGGVGATRAAVEVASAGGGASVLPELLLSTSGKTASSLATTTHTTDALVGTSVVTSSVPASTPSVASSLFIGSPAGTPGISTAATTTGMPVFGLKPIFGGLAAKDETGSMFSSSKPLFGDIKNNLPSASTISVTSTSTPAYLFGTGAPGSTVATAATTAPTPSLFSSSTVESGVKLFASPVTTASTAGTFVGSPNAALITSPTRGLFGTTNVSSSATTVAMPVTSPPTGGLFGTSQAAPIISPASGGLFGTPQTAPTTSPSAGGLFGSSKMPLPMAAVGNSASSGGLFGAPSSTATTVGGLFASPSTTVTSPSGSIFGASVSAVGGTLFSPSTTGAMTSPTGGIFGTTATAVTGTLFGSSPPTQSASPGGLFGAPIVPSVTAAPTADGLTSGLSICSPTKSPAGLFGGAQGNTNQSVGGLFATMTTTSVASTTGLFQQQQQQPANTTSLFGSVKPVEVPQSAAVSTTSPGLFGAGTVAQQSDNLKFGAGGGIFNNVSSNASKSNIAAPASGGGLFASSTGAAGDISNAFANSTFGLGGGNSQAPGLFGRPAASATAPAQNTGLFGSAASQPASTGGLFGAPAFTFKQQQATATTTTASFNLFGSPASSTTSAVGGLFGNSNKPAAANGGFGVAPLFGTPTFGSAGVGLFASSGAPAGGVSLFGGATQGSSAGAELFASLAAKDNGTSFGSLATGLPSPPQQQQQQQLQQTSPVAASLFGTSPSFTQRRA